MAESISCKSVLAAALDRVAITLAVRGWVEINDKGQGDGVMFNAAVHSAVVAHDAGQRDEVPAGVLLWCRNPETADAFITVAYVEPEYRGKGVFKKMLSELIEIAGSVDAPKIALITSVRNNPMRKVAERTGFAEEAVLCTLNLR